MTPYYDFVGGPLDGSRRNIAPATEDFWVSPTLNYWNPDHPDLAGPSVKLKARYYYVLKNGKYHYDYPQTVAANAHS